VTTFSQLVDDLVRERQRPDLLQSAAMGANQVIRQIHFRGSGPGGSRIQFDANRFEASITLEGAEPFLWPIPHPNRFQGIEAIWNRTLNGYHQLRRPAVNRALSKEPFAERFWYRTGPQIALSGARLGHQLDISFFEYPRRLPYLAVADRTVIYNAEEDTYELAGGGTPTEEQLEAETNWVLTRWASVVEAGVRNLLFAYTGDEARTRVSFSIFENLRTQLWHEEPSTVGGD
jgi:hypothetical protein